MGDKVTTGAQVAWQATTEASAKVAEGAKTAFDESAKACRDRVNVATPTETAASACDWWQKHGFVVMLSAVRSSGRSECGVRPGRPAFLIRSHICHQAVNGAVEQTKRQAAVASATASAKNAVSGLMG